MIAPNAPPESHAPKTFQWKLEYTHCCVIAGAALLIFANTLGNGFHIDDYDRIVGNAGIHSFWPPWRHFVDYHTQSPQLNTQAFRPMLPLTLSINYALAGDSLPGYHLGNILCDILAALALYFIVLELLGNWIHKKIEVVAIHNIALVVALLFAVHPVTGFLINYLCSRDQLMMSMFFLSGFLAYLRMRRIGENWKRWCLVLLLFGCAILSKTDAGLAPVFIVLFEVILAGASLTDIQLWRRVATLALIPIAFITYTTVVLHLNSLTNLIHPQITWEHYALIQSQLHLTYYMRNFIWPMNVLANSVPFDPVIHGYIVVLGLSFIAATIYFAVRWRNTNPLASFCIGAYWIMVVTTTSVMPIAVIASDYRPHPGSPWIYLFVVVALYQLLRKEWRMPVAVAGILYVGLAAYENNPHYRTEETFWKRFAELCPTPMAHTNYAQGIADRHDPRVRRELEAALEMDSTYVAARVDHGLLLMDCGDTTRALFESNRATEFYPAFAMPHYFYATLLDRAKMFSSADSEFEKAFALEPTNPQYNIQQWHSKEHLLQRANYLYQSRDYAACVTQCKAALVMDSNYVDAYVTLSAAYNNLGDYDDGAANARIALMRDPHNTLAQGNLDYAMRNATAKESTHE